MATGEWGWGFMLHLPGIYNIIAVARFIGVGSLFTPL